MGEEEYPLRVVTLMDNTAREGLLAEWGLSFLIEYRGGKYLLDAGSSDRFARNCDALGIDLAQVDAAVLSHAHYDHSGGLETFCMRNDHAPIYMRAEVGENCYSRHGLRKVYIGVQKGFLDRWRARIVRVEGDCAIADGMLLLPHKLPDMERRGRRAHLYLRQGWRFRPDDFRHEQSLVVDTPEGLAILNSCSHGGVDAILEEVRATFPARPIRAMAGGFHLFRSSPDQVRALGRRLAEMDAPDLYTGHCTGRQAMEILSEILPGKVHPLESGSVFEFNDGGSAL